MLVAGVNPATGLPANVDAIGRRLQVEDVQENALFANFTGTGVNDNDILFTTSDVSIFNVFQLMTSAGNVDVLVSLDGTNYSTVALAMEDQGSTTPGTYVVATAAVGRVYRFTGKYANIRVLQNGATAATATLRCAVS